MPSITDSEREQEGAAVAFLDERLLEAVGIANMDLRQEYQQVQLTAQLLRQYVMIATKISYRTEIEVRK